MRTARPAERERRPRVEVHAPGLDEVAGMMDRVCGEVGDQGDAFLTAAARRLLARVEW